MEVISLSCIIVVVVKHLSSTDPGCPSLWISYSFSHSVKSTRVVCVYLAGPLERSNIDMEEGVYPLSVIPALFHRQCHMMLYLALKSIKAGINKFLA